MSQKAGLVLDDFLREMDKIPPPSLSLPLAGVERLQPISDRQQSVD